MAPNLAGFPLVFPFPPGVPISLFCKRPEIEKNRLAHGSPFHHYDRNKSICLSVCLSIYLSIYLSVCPPKYLSVYLSICLPTVFQEWGTRNPLLPRFLPHRWRSILSSTSVRERGAHPRSCSLRGKQRSHVQGFWDILRCPMCSRTPVDCFFQREIIFLN